MEKVQPLEHMFQINTLFSIFSSYCTTSEQKIKVWMKYNRSLRGIFKVKITIQNQNTKNEMTALSFL